MKNINRKIVSAALAALLSLSSMSALAIDASAAWVKNGKGYGYVDDNTGAYATGWKYIGNKKYYFGTNGVMRTGWQAIGGNTYYFGRNGVMRTGKRKIGGKIYNFGKNGILNGSTINSMSKASDVLDSIKDSLGSSYTCDNVCTSDRLENLGFDMRYVKSFAYEEDSVSTINYDIAIVVKVSSSYTNKAIKILQDYYQQILAVSQLYNADVYRVEQARIFSQNGYVALLILGDNEYSDYDSEEDKADYAFGEALKVDNAWKNIFGSVPDNLANIDEDEGIGIGSSLE